MCYIRYCIIYYIIYYMLLTHSYYIILYNILYYIIFNIILCTGKPPHGSRNQILCRLAGLPAGWFAAWFFSWLAGWRVGGLLGWQSCSLAGWLFGRLAGWQISKFTGWQVGNTIRHNTIQLYYNYFALRASRRPWLFNSERVWFWSWCFIWLERPLKQCCSDLGPGFGPPGLHLGLLGSILDLLGSI